MSSTLKYVVYYIVPLHHGSDPKLYANQAIAQQEKRIQDFLKEHPDYQVIKTFIESGDNFRYRHRWPELESAINCCLENEAHLLIPEIKNLTHNESFSKHIVQLISGRGDNQDPTKVFHGEIHCCDQPFINKDNFVAIAEHAKQQKMLHGQLIRAGLSRTTAKSGNPHALDVITKVNKPKIENAVIFALLLQPVIAEYKLKGLSQRKMVSALNEEGFHAPEGGQWVLSQLQKVLDRIKINDAAFQLENKFQQYHSQKLSSSEIAKTLNEAHQVCPLSETWTEEAVEKIEERIVRIREITKFYRLALELIPVIQKYHVDELTESLFNKELQHAGIIHPWGHG